MLALPRESDGSLLQLLNNVPRALLHLAIASLAESVFDLFGSRETRATLETEGLDLDFTVRRNVHFDALHLTLTSMRP